MGPTWGAVWIFVAIPSVRLETEDVRSKVKKWSDYIDYWAVDWDFQNDTFMQGWVAYRTRKERKLSLASDPHTYEKPGKHRFTRIGNPASLDGDAAAPLGFTCAMPAHPTIG